MIWYLFQFSDAFFYNVYPHFFSSCHRTNEANTLWLRYNLISRLEDSFTFFREPSLRIPIYYSPGSYFPTSSVLTQSHWNTHEEKENKTKNGKNFFFTQMTTNKIVDCYFYFPSYRFTCTTNENRNMFFVWSNITLCPKYREINVFALAVICRRIIKYKCTIIYAYLIFRWSCFQWKRKQI